MPGKTYDGARRTYLSIVGGLIRQNVGEGFKNAVKREYELKNGTKGVKWELVFNEWTGHIVSLTTKETEFGVFLNIEFDDAVLSIGTESKYFSDFVRKLASVKDLSLPVTVKPFDFEDDKGKRLTGVTVLSDGVKMENFFYDPIAKKNIHDYPTPTEEERKTWNKQDWRHYFGYTTVKFLTSYMILAIAPKLQAIADAKEQADIDESAKENVAHAKKSGENTLSLDDPKEEIDIASVPF